MIFTKIVWQLDLLLAADQKIIKFEMKHLTAKLPDFWWDAVNACSFVTLKTIYGFNRFKVCRRFVNVLFAWKLRNTIDGSVQHIAVSTEEVLEVLILAKTDGTIVREEFLPIRTVKGV